MSNQWLEIKSLKEGIDNVKNVKTKYETEQEALCESKKALQYAINNGQPYPEGEHLIAKNAWFSCEYAERVLKDRFPAGEPAILQSSSFAYRYAKNVIKGPWPEAEDILAKHVSLSVKYAIYVLKDRFQQSESHILAFGDPQYILEYAKEAIKDRWPEGAFAIQTNSQTAYEYARDVIKGPWPEVEKMISRSSYYSLAYAKNILKGRFIKGENAIKVNETCKQEYIRFLQRCLDDLTNLDEGTVESLEQTL